MNNNSSNRHTLQFPWLRVFPIFIFVSISAFIITSCKPVPLGEFRVQKPPPIKLQKFHSVSVAVSSQVPNSDDIVLQLESTIISKLFEKRLFKKVYSTETSAKHSPDLKIGITITKIKKVSPHAQAFFGSWAGQAYLVVLIELFDAQSGKSLATAEAEGKTPSFPPLGSARTSGETTYKALERVAEQVVDFVAKYK